jgi:hypothetical protein
MPSVADVAETDPAAAEIACASTDDADEADDAASA